MSVVPPGTLEGWYALHQIFALDWGALAGMSDAERARVADGARETLAALAAPEGEGWSGAFRLVGGGADWMLIHFRDTAEALADANLMLRRSPVGPLLRLTYDYFSVTEAGLYHATAEAATVAPPGTEEFRQALEEAAAAERASPHVKARLYPSIPEGMRYVSFYPMSKRRMHPDNWYTLPVEERSKLMRDHGLTGRKYSRRIYQVITGSVGLDDWEWGVTLFARDLLDIKAIVTELRYDPASSRYGEFGSFYTGILATPESLADTLRRP